MRTMPRALMRPGLRRRKGIEMELLCEHANECPADCPCPAKCICRSRGGMCESFTGTVEERRGSPSWGEAEAAVPPGESTTIRWPSPVTPLDEAGGRYTRGAAGVLQFVPLEPSPSVRASWQSYWGTAPGVCAPEGPEMSVAQAFDEEKKNPPTGISEARWSRQLLAWAEMLSVAFQKRSTGYVLSLYASQAREGKRSVLEHDVDRKGRVLGPKTPAPAETRRRAPVRVWRP